MECQYNNIKFLPLMYVLMILLHMLLTLTCVSDLGQEWHKQRQNSSFFLLMLQMCWLVHYYKNVIKINCNMEGIYVIKDLCFTLSC